MRYDAIVHPPHGMRTQKPEVDGFVEKNEAQRAATIAARGWDRQQLRINYRFLQVWDLLSLYFSCTEPVEDYIEPVPTNYRDGEREGVRMTLRPVGKASVAIDPYPFDVDDLRVQLSWRRMKLATFDHRDATVELHVQAPLSTDDLDARRW